MNITEKAAHLKGLLEGMDYDLTTKEGKLFAAISDLLEDIALTVSDLDDETAVLGDYIEEIDEDLGEIERTVYDCDDDCCCDDDDCCDDDCDCGCDCDCDDDCVSLTCPACGEEICVDEDAIDEMETITCPACNKELNIVREDDCCCGCNEEE